MWILFTIVSLFGGAVLLIPFGILAGLIGRESLAADLIITGIICTVCLAVPALTVLVDFTTCDGNAAQIQLEPAWDATAGGCRIVLPSGSVVPWSWLNVNTHTDGTVTYMLVGPEERN